MKKNIEEIIVSFFVLLSVIAVMIPENYPPKTPECPNGSKEEKVTED